jgi:hypothetical protein
VAFKLSRGCSSCEVALTTNLQWLRPSSLRSISPRHTETEKSHSKQLSQPIDSTEQIWQLVGPCRCAPPGQYSSPRFSCCSCTKSTLLKRYICVHAPPAGPAWADSLRGDPAVWFAWPRHVASQPHVLFSAHLSSAVPILGERLA